VAGRQPHPEQHLQAARGGGDVVDDHVVRLESTVAQLRLAVQSLQQRVDALEASRAGIADGALAEAARPEPKPADVARTRRDPYDPIVVLSLIGRLFLVLAGGFFLRAMTEAGVLAAPVGVGLAFVYAFAWLYLTDRSSRSGQSSSTLFHALGAAMVAFPLLVEATTRFQVIGVAGSVLGLVLLTTAFLFVAARRRLHAVAWLTVVAALLTSIVLALKTGVAPPFALYLIALGVTTLWLAYSYGWTAIRWPVALAADLAVVGLTLRVLAPGQSGTVRVVMFLQVMLVGAYLGSIAVRTLLRDRNVTLFEATQSVLALVAGFGGAILLTRSTATLPVLMGVASIVMGAACYALAFRFVGRHEGHERNVHFYAALALVLVLAGLALDLSAQWLGAVSAAFAVLAVAGWSRYGRLYLLLHGVAYVLASGISSHALGYGAWALFANPQHWVVPSAAMEIMVVAAALAAWLAARRPHPDGGMPASGMRLVIVVTLVWAAAGCITGLLAPMASRLADGTVDLGALATVRTGVLAVAALLVAWVGRRAGFREWVWLVYPLLVLIGLKMVAQDFKYSRPATLFIALAFYGIALIVAPRLRRGRERVVVQPAAAGASADPRRGPTDPGQALRRGGMNGETA
jgi:hypothetical protein